MREIKFRYWTECDGYFDLFEMFNDASHVRYDGTNINGGVLEQYTGMKDKGGVEIYEGDIVRGYLEDGEFGTRTVSFDYDRDYAGWNIEPGWCDRIRVRGNIHEDLK